MISHLNSPKVALLIGIEYRNTANELLGCQTDVLNMRNLLVNKMGYLPNNIMLITDDYGPKPTGRNIVNALEILAKMTINNNYNEAIIYYSGHGNQIRDNNNEEIDKMDEVLVPDDYTNGLIRDDTIYQILKRFSNRTHTLCIFDSCNSGTICDLEYSYYYNINNDSTQIIQTENHHLNNSIVCISGCKDNQTSNVVLTERGWHSALTTALIDIFSKFPQGITFHQLDKALNLYMYNQGIEQNPVLSSSWPKTPGSIISLIKSDNTPFLSREQMEITWLMNNRY